MSNQVLDQVCSKIAEAPHSASALTLYALVSTLEFSAAGYLFKLDKLCTLDKQDRKLAYALMELMAEGKNQGEAWTQAKVQMDDLIRGS